MRANALSWACIMLLPMLAAAPGQVNTTKSSGAAKQQQQTMHRKIGKLCFWPGCLRRRAYGFPNPVFNTTGDEESDIESKHNPAAHDVRNSSSSNKSSDLVPVDRAAVSTPQFCAQHKTKGQVNLMTRRCAASGCERAASFGPPCQIEDQGHCGAGSGLKAIVNKSSAPQKPVEGPRRARRMLWCAEHRGVDDVDFRRFVGTHCLASNCVRRGSSR